MPIISILNPKGGSGKTTLSTNMARAFYERGHSVLLVDSDPQGSARDWHAADEKNPLPLISLDRANNMPSLKSVSASYDFTVIDGAAKLEDMIAAGIKAADMVVIPVQPSPYDIWAVSDLVDLIKARQEVTDGLPVAGFAITRAIKGTTLGAEIYEALDEYGLKGLGGTAQRQIYPQTSAEGKTVFDGSNTAAIEEINPLIIELLKYTNKDLNIQTKGVLNNGTINKAAQ